MLRAGLPEPCRHWALGEARAGTPPRQPSREHPSRDEASLPLLCAVVSASRFETCSANASGWTVSIVRKLGSRVRSGRELQPCPHISCILARPRTLCRPLFVSPRATLLGTASPTAWRVSYVPALPFRPDPYLAFRRFPAREQLKCCRWLQSRLDRNMSSHRPSRKSRYSH
jgi:hypothetical protein